MRRFLFQQRQTVLQLIHAAVLETLRDDYWLEESLTGIGTFVEGVPLHVPDIGVERKCKRRTGVDRNITFVRPLRVFQPFHFEFVVRSCAAMFGFAVLSSCIEPVSKLTGITRGRVPRWETQLLLPSLDVMNSL
jgi:hypothetical protein